MSEQRSEMWDQLLHQLQLAECGWTKRGRRRRIQRVARILDDLGDRADSDGVSGICELLGRVRTEAHLGSGRHARELIRECTHLPHVLGLFSFSHDGYVREAAVIELAKHDSGEEIAYLLLRANDWVEVIQKRCRTALEARVVSKNALRFARLFCFVESLHRATRAEHSLLVSSIVRLIVAEHEAFMFCQRHPERRVRRAIWWLALQHAQDLLDSWLEAMLEDSDPMVRDRGARQLCRCADPERIRPVLPLLLSSSRPGIRRDALRAIAAHFPAEHENLKPALLDPGASVRMTACFLVRECFPGFDVAEFYRSRLAATRPRVRAAACAGLGVVGSRQDCELVLAHIAAGEALCVRKEALRALANLNPEAHAQLLFDALCSSTPGISRAAALALHGNRARLPGLCGLVRHHALPHVRLNALRLLTHVDKWSRLAALLGAARDPECHIRQAALMRIGDFLRNMNKTFITPSKEQLAEVRAEFAASAHWLNDRYREQLRFALATT